MTEEEFLKIYNDADKEPDFHIVRYGEWMDEGKFANQEVVYQVGEQYFAIVLSRSGSYFSDYYYDEPFCAEVVPKEIVKVEYVTKKP